MMASCGSLCKPDEGWWCSKESRFYDPETGWSTPDPKDRDLPEDQERNCPQIRAPQAAKQDMPESDWKKLDDSTKPEIAHRMELEWRPASESDVSVAPDLKAGERKRSYSQTSSTQVKKVEVIVLLDELLELVVDLENFLKK